MTKAPQLPQTGDIVSVPLGDGVEMKFAFIPPGTFLMGSPASEQNLAAEVYVNEADRYADEVLHRVILTKGFYLGIHPVTQAQWQALRGSNPSRFKGDDLPVEYVTWHDCDQFCKDLSEKTGKKFRLPTEAEWEYACRAGTTTPFWCGNTISTEQANYNGNPFGNGSKGESHQKTTPVDKFDANPWRIHDMHGNVEEWCNDWYGPLDGGEIADPEGPQSGTARVMRGGSWGCDPGDCRAAYRGRIPPGDRLDYFGFRVVLCLD